MVCLGSADVRLVLHLNLPKTLEGFYQESGRAGRDGRPSRSILCYSRADRDRMDYILGKEAKRGKKRKLGAEDSAAAGSQNAMQAFSKVVAYCTHTACRRMMVLQHFGERLSAGACSGCDYCSNAQLVHTQLAELQKDVVTYSRGRGRQSQLQQHTYDAASSASDEEAGGCSQISDVEALQSTEADAVALAARRAGALPAGIVEALAKAEKKLTSSTADSSLDARLTAAETGPIPAKLRQSGTAAVLKALQASSHAQSATADRLTAAAQVLEQRCFADAGSKAVYKSMLANRCRNLGSLPELPVKRADGQSVVPEMPRSASDIWTQIGDMLKSWSSTPEDSLKTGSIICDLQSMAQVPISKAELSCGLGKQLKSLSKHSHAGIAAAALNVVLAFRQHLSQQ